MITRKIVKNNGFTLYEMLSVIGIIAIICSIALPVSVTSYNKYKESVFEQKCLIYENSFIDAYKYFTYERKGRLSSTNNVIIKVPFSYTIQTEEELFVDMLDEELVWAFICETLSKSGFSYTKINYVYSPAVIVKKYTFYPSSFILYLDDDVKIVYNFKVISSRVGANQVATFNNIIISNGKFSYEFTI